MKKIFFPKRIAEPEEMEKLELDAFEKISKDSYKRWNIPLVDHALEKTKIKSGRILDIGCGPGLLTKEFAQRSNQFQIYGLDISPYAIKQAKRNCKGLINVSFKTGSIYRLPFPRNYFDLVICKDSLHQFPRNPIGALKEMFRVLIPGKTLYVHDLRRDVPHYLLKRVLPPKTIFQKLLYYSARAAYTKKEVRQFLKDIGAINISVNTRKVTTKIRNKYQRVGIEIPLLKESFQSRYVAIAKKPR